MLRSQASGRGQHLSQRGGLLFPAVVGKSYSEANINGMKMDPVRRIVAAEKLTHSQHVKCVKVNRFVYDNTKYRTLPMILGLCARI